VEHERLRRAELEVEDEALVPSAKTDRCAVGARGLHAPVLDRDTERLAARAREARGAAAHALRGRVAPAGDICDREVREVDLVRGEACGGRRSGRKAAAEESELEAEAAAVLRLELAGVVPPLGLELEVRAVVQRQPELAGRGRSRERGRLAGRELQRRPRLREEQGGRQQGGE
jgi:hypothetical protein